MTKLANWPITDAPDDIVVSLCGSFQLDFVVYDATEGFRRWPTESVIGSHSQAFYLLRHATRGVEKTNDCGLLIHAVLSFLLHVSSLIQCGVYSIINYVI